MKIALYECMRFTCPHCESICIFPSSMFEVYYNCDVCGKVVMLTPDELIYNGEQVIQSDIEVIGTIKDAD